MPSKLLSDAMAAFEGNAVTREWPSNVVMYANTDDQSLITETANSRAVEALLKVHNLLFEKCQRRNAEHIVDGGRLPFLRIGEQIEGEDAIINYLSKFQCSLLGELDESSRLMAKAMLSMVKCKLEPFELYYTWLDEKNRAQTFTRYESRQPAPLRQMLCHQKQRAIADKLQRMEFPMKNEKQVQHGLGKVLDSFAEKLTTNKGHLAGYQLTEADIYLFGHLQVITEMKQPNPVLQRAVDERPVLRQFCNQFNEKYLGEKPMGMWEFV